MAKAIKSARKKTKGRITSKRKSSAGRSVKEKRSTVARRKAVRKRKEKGIIAKVRRAVDTIIESSAETQEMREKAGTRGGIGEG
jgi:hypothetical protein